MLRHGLSRSAIAWFGRGFPLGTLSVNALGSLVLGLLYALASRRALSPEVHLVLGTGLCGALTTFSTFSVETLVFVEEGELGWALANVALNVLVGFGAAAIGMALIR